MPGNRRPLSSAFALRNAPVSSRPPSKMCQVPVNLASPATVKSSSAKKISFIGGSAMSESTMR